MVEAEVDEPQIEAELAPDQRPAGASVFCQFARISLLIPTSET